MEEDSDAPEVPAGGSSSGDRACSLETKVAALVEVFGVSEASIYNWLKQDRIDRGELEGLSTDQALELAAARRRIKQLETELAVARKVNEVFLKEGIHPKGCSR